MITPRINITTLAQTGVLTSEVGGKVKLVHVMFTQLQFGNVLETQFELTAALVALMQTPLFEKPVEH
jgi:hypothetical protein